MVRIVATPGFISKLGQAKLLWGVNVQWDVSNRWIIRLVQLVVEGWRSFCCLNPFLRVFIGFFESPPLYPESCFGSSLECSGGNSRHSGDACARACYDPFDSAARRTAGMRVRVRVRVVWRFRLLACLRWVTGVGSFLFQLNWLVCHKMNLSCQNLNTAGWMICVNLYQKVYW